ncbi:exported protein of unknown function; putative LGFP repeats [Modestobacter italicus]|uniref:LGFP repeat-containing protein n=1 Tax=Modestobacter italicus (strain DSM 44449 / CECT 9708 / BC 501) TaxID=2732864 RepID=I4ES09_MODI5|nr:hypothetical protein [Modestobacter marinus]CCH86172.1 exported protein of unknown function; putative LGFP repeats [Modestobacter marinus]
MTRQSGQDRPHRRRGARSVVVALALCSIGLVAPPASAAPAGTTAPATSGTVSPSATSLLPAPGLYDARVFGTRVRLDWVVVPGAVGYQVRRDGHPLPPISGASTGSWSDDDLQVGVSYSYTVSAVDSRGVEGAESRAVTAVPEPPVPAPTGLVVTVSPGRAELSWDDLGPSAEYLVLRDGRSQRVSGSARWSDTDLLAGQYTYRLARPEADDHPGTPSDPVTVTVPGEPSTPISVVYRALGGPEGVLGHSVTGEYARAGGTVRDYANGSVLLAPGATTAYYTDFGASRYAQLGGPAGSLGWPTSNPVDLAGTPMRYAGHRQEFQGGSLYEYPLTGGPHLVTGVIRDRWRGLGAEAGALGYPLTDTVCGLRNGGCFQQFQGGSLYWSAATGVRRIEGAIGSRWAAQGWERGTLGYPTTDAVCGIRDGGCYQHFQGGSVYSYRYTGTWVVGGAIRDRWAAQGWENGPLGYPMSDEACGLRDGGCYQLFQWGSVHWSPRTGPRITEGAIRDAWGAQGWERGGLGYPTTEAACGIRDGGCFQVFQGGSVYWSRGTGALPVSGAIRDAWAWQGWENGRLGYPIRGPVCGLRDGGCFQVFQGGSVYWSPRTGARPVSGALRDGWASQGWENGRLGYPVGDAYGVPGGSAQDFQQGTVSYRDNRVSITYR